MSFHELEARFERLHREHAAWRLLRADLAPMILSFIADLFEDAHEVDFGRAKVALDSELAVWRAQGLRDSETNATVYLRQWIQSGWLRELDDRLSRTDACEIALRFCRQLDQRESNATASHLRIVQDAVRDLSIAISQDPDQRAAMLEARKAEIQRELDELNAGIVRKLTDAEQRERMIEIYQLASVLTLDFRRVEDEIRALDQDLRVQMIESGDSRGTVILRLLEQEHSLAESDAGRAFDSFFQLLCDQNRGTEFREQLKAVLSHEAAKNLNENQARFLCKLLRELNRESERVFQVRGRTMEKLRQFVESGAASELRAVDRLLGKLEKIAVGFKDSDLSMRESTHLCLPSGMARIQSLASLRLRMPEEKLNTQGIQEQTNAASPSDEMLRQLHTVQVMQIAAGMLDSLRKSRIPLSVAELIKRRPVHAGLEELVACLRIAKAVNATEIPNRETVMITERNGCRLNAQIPCYLLSAEGFPERLEDLKL